MADTLTEAHYAARTTRTEGATRLEKSVLARVRNHYRGALARGQDDNQDKRGPLATEARTLIARSAGSKT
jgi:transposase